MSTTTGVWARARSQIPKKLIREDSYVVDLFNYLQLNAHDNTGEITMSDNWSDTAHRSVNRRNRIWREGNPQKRILL